MEEGCFVSLIGHGRTPFVFSVAEAEAEGVVDRDALLLQSPVLLLLDADGSSLSLRPGLRGLALWIIPTFFFPSFFLFVSC